MIEVLVMPLGAFAAGMLLALGYLWHLHWTVAELAKAGRPGWRLATGLATRLLAACAVFYLIGRYGGASGIVAALLGFLLARTIVISRTRARLPGGSTAS